MSASGNGHTPAPVVAAQQQLEAAEKPLQKLNADISAMQLKITEAETALFTAEGERAKAEGAFVDDSDNPKVRQRFFAAGQEVDGHKAKTKVLKDRLSRLEAQKPELDAPYQAACVALSKAQREWRKQVVQDEMAHAKFKLGQAQQQAMEWQRRVNTLKDEELQITRQEQTEFQNRNSAAARARFAAVNGPTPGFERTRTGF